MGVIIFTKDDTRFLTGHHLVMYKSIDTSLSHPDITYILRTDKFTEADALSWIPYINNRLIVTIDKLPKLTAKSEDFVVVDGNYTKAKINFAPITNLLRWQHRTRVYHAIQQMPVPLALSFIKSNVDDIDFWRTMVNTGIDLPDYYTYAVMSYYIKPKSNSQINWPKKKKKGSEIMKGMRNSDKYMDEIQLGLKKSKKEDSVWF
tara:strand:+ start:14213 stop:14824 length:612 start_codon:yes stop_codon:yes gene_type:complete